MLFSWQLGLRLPWAVLQEGDTYQLGSLRGNCYYLTSPRVFSYLQNGDGDRRKWGNESKGAL